MQFSLGQSRSITRHVAAADVEAFARITGDTNPVHLDEAYAAGTRFKRRIAHGMLTASYISALLGAEFPGPGTIYLSQSVTFLKPVFIGDTLTVTATVAAYRPEKAILTLTTECRNQAGEKVLEGQAVCLVSDVAAPSTSSNGAAHPAGSNGTVHGPNGARPTGLHVANGKAASNGAPEAGTGTEAVRG